MHDLARDLTLGWRRLRATPTFTLFSVMTLALGIGVTSAISSVVRAVIGPPPGVRDVETIVNVYHTAAGSLPMIGLSWPDYQDFKSQQTVFENVTAWTFFRQAFAANGHAETAFGELVGGEYFDVLRVNAEVGRTLQAADDRVGAPPVAVISHQVWLRVFGGAPDIVGRVIKMNGHSFEIVGVAPSAFRGLFNNGFVPSAIWVPLASVPLLPSGNGHTLDSNDRERRWLLVKGRLKPGRSLSDVQAEATGIARQLDSAYPIGRGLAAQVRSPYRTSRPWTVRRASDIIMGEFVDPIMRPLIATLMTAVGLVLLIACTNLANLMLARGAGRRHEIAVRLALGASRWRLVREALAESVILAAVGGLLSLLITQALIVAIGTDVAIGNGAALHVEPVVDAVVLLASACATLLAVLIAGLGPALQSTRADVRSALATDSAGGALPRWRGRRALIATQATVSLLLLAIASLCVTQVRQDTRNDSGLDLEHLAVVEVDFGLQRYEPERVRQIVDAVLDQVGRQPNVEAVAASSGLPVGVYTPGGFVRTPDEATGAYVDLLASTPGIFHALGVSIARGRALDGRDLAGAAPVIVVSERLARTLFSTVEVVGRPVIFKRRRWVGLPEPKDERVTIVGVAADTDTGSARQRDHGTAYLPLAQHFEGRLVLSARSSGDPVALVSALRKALQAVDPEVAVSQAGTGLAVAGPSNLFLQVTAALASLLGSFALLLALAGLYGALSHVVARRTREIGVRLALGASPRQIIRMVLVDGLRPVVYGVTMGLTLSLVARMALQPFFVRFMPVIDPFAATIAPVSMILAALIACYLPASRAARVEPNVALRDL